MGIKHKKFRGRGPGQITFSTLKLHIGDFKNEDQIHCFWVPVSPSALHVTTPAPALLSACLCTTGLLFSSRFQASPPSPVSLDPSRRIVVQPHLTCPVIMLCTGNGLERMAVVGLSSSRWVKIRLHLPYSLGISLAETITATKRAYL